MSVISFKEAQQAAALAEFKALLADLREKHQHLELARSQLSPEEIAQVTGLTISELDQQIAMIRDLLDKRQDDLS